MHEVGERMTSASLDVGLCEMDCAEGLTLLWESVRSIRFDPPAVLCDILNYDHINTSSVELPKAGLVHSTIHIVYRFI